MRKAFALGIAAFVLSACQPMYGSRPEKMRTPPRATAVPTEELPAGPAYVENCQVDFQKAPPKTGVARDVHASVKLVDRGDEVLTMADATTDGVARGHLVLTSIDRYSSALARDPYNADATLKLALAYDRVYRKGCALALLKRLVALAGNPKFEPDATADMNRVDDNKQWFRSYRDAALKAIGH